MKNIYTDKSYLPKLILVILLLSSSPVKIWSQFGEIIGLPDPVDEKSPGGVIMPSGGYLMLGSNQKHPNAINTPFGDMQVVRLDNSGNIVYSKLLGKKTIESATWIEKIGFCSSPDDCMITGNSEDSIMVAQIDDATQQTWVYNYALPGTVLTSACVKMDANSLIVVVGSSKNLSNNKSSVVIIQMDCFGSPIWKRFFPVNNYSLVATSVTTFNTNPGGPPGAYYITGKATPMSGGNDQMFIMKISTTGNFGFLQLYDVGINTSDIGNCIQGSFAFNAQGELWVAGYSQSNTGTKSIVMMKTDINGTPLWVRNLDIASGDELATHFSFTPANKIVLTGEAGIVNVAGNQAFGNCFLMRMDENINTIDWTNLYILGYSDQGNKVEVTSGDEYFIAGQSLEVFGTQFSNNMLAIKTDHQGNLIDDTCTYNLAVQVNNIMPVTTTISPAALTIGDIPAPIGTYYDTIPYIDSTYKCAVSQNPECNLTWVYKNCFEVEFTASSAFPQPGNYTFDWNILCDATIESHVVVGTSTNTFSFTFPCGGGTYPVCVTIQEPSGFVCSLMYNVTVQNTCCGQVISKFVLCTDSTNYYYYNIIVSDPPYVGLNCTPVLTNLTAGTTLINSSYSFTGNGTTVFEGIVLVPSNTPLNLNFGIQFNCTCPSGAPVVCNHIVSIPTICCKKITVDDQVVCEDAFAFGIPITTSMWPPLNNISQVTWYVIPKPAGGCPTTQWGGSPYQQTLGNLPTSLVLYPANLQEDLCFYAVVHLDDGPCTEITSNIASVTLCGANSCTLNDQNICYFGSPVTPVLISSTITSPSNGCAPFGIEWFDPFGNHVQSGGATYLPTSGLSMSNPQNCYEDFYYTMMFNDLCGQHTCQAKVRLYSNQATIGKLEMDPTEQQPLCRGEDISLKFTANCTGEPPEWKWYTRDCQGSAPIQIPGSGTKNPGIHSNKLFQSIIYRVEADNGVCPVKAEEFTVQVKDPSALLNFNAVSDPCAEQQVLLDVMVTPCNISCFNTPCTCTYTVKWYRNGNLIGTTNGGPSQSFVYTSAPLAGNYYAVISEDCCPRNIINTFPVTIYPSCEPTIMGPCFICDNNPVTLMAQMILPPTTPCPNFCNFNWYKWTGAWTYIGSGPTIPVSMSGLYQLESDCNGCIKYAIFYLPQCQSFTGGGNVCSVTCCIDETTFDLLIESETSITLDSCAAKVSIGNIPDCDQMDIINWGDGAESFGPYFNGDIISHSYTGAGTYIVTYSASEQDAEHGSPCFTRTFTDTITPVCNNICACIPWPSLTLNPGTGVPTTTINCGNDIFINCTNGVTSTLTGTYQCLGCGPSTVINWQLYHPSVGFIDAGTVTATPGFSISLPSGYFYLPGTYTFTLTAICSGNPCPCTFYFVVPQPCPGLCPCDLMQFQRDVAAGYLIITSLTNPCRKCFYNRRLNPCDKVEWSISPNPLNIVATTYGNQSFCYTFSPGTYTLYRKVTRRKGVNLICGIFTTQRTFTINCNTGGGSNCSKTRLFNPGFDDQPVKGILGQGGSSAHWIRVSGTPSIDTSFDSQDGWILNLSGNKDTYDAISQDQPICLEKDSGTISILLRAAKLNGLPVIPKDGEKLVIRFVRGDNLLPANCTEPECYNIAEIPLTRDLDGWSLVELDYDISDAEPEDTCGQESSLLVHPVFYITNDQDSSLGSDSTSHVQVDLICLQGPLKVSTSFPQGKTPTRIFPNPTSGDISVEFSKPATSDMSFRILSIDGKILVVTNAEVGKTIQSLEADHLAEGMYFIQVVSSGRVLSMAKFVKM